MNQVISYLNSNRMCINLWSVHNWIILVSIVTEFVGNLTLQIHRKLHRNSNDYTGIIYLKKNNYTINF